MGLKKKDWRTHATKEKNRQIALHEKKILCIRKQYQQGKIKTQWLVANPTSDKGLTSRIYRELLKFINKNSQTIWFQNGQRTWIDISPKKTYKWPIRTWKDSRHHYSSRKCKSKPQWDITLYPLKWLLSKTKGFSPIFLLYVSSLLTIFFIMINKQKKGCGQSWKPCALLLRRWNTAAVKQYDVPKKVKIELPFMIQWLYSEHILPQTENRRDVCASMFIGVLDTITKMWKQPKYSTMDERISKVWYVHTGEYYSALRRKFWCMLQHGWKLRTLC